VFTLHEISLCVREAGRSGEAEELLKRALVTMEAKEVDYLSPS